MNMPYHQKEFRLAFVSPSTNLLMKSQECLRSRLGIRARLVPFESIRELNQTIRMPSHRIEMVVLDSSAITSLQDFPQFLAYGEIGLPVLLLLRKGETEMAEGAMEAGYKALLFIDNDAEYRQSLPAMVLRIIAYYRGERQREYLSVSGNSARTASDLDVSDRLLA